MGHGYRPRQIKSTLIRTDNLFSDLNQWMLKILLAPELPEGMLNAPRGQYRNGVELARAAQVSAMTASRFLQQLRRERFLLESEEFLTLVQKEELFERWSAVAQYGTADVPKYICVRRMPRFNRASPGSDPWNALQPFSEGGATGIAAGRKVSGIDVSWGCKAGWGDGG